MSGVDVQDHKIVTLGSHTNRTANDNKIAQAGDKKKVGVAGLNKKLDGSAAAQLDLNEVKAPTLISKDVGRVGRWLGLVPMSELNSCWRRLSVKAAKPKGGRRKTLPAS